VAARLSYLIKWIERGVRAQLDASLQELRVTTPEYAALSALRYRGGLSSAQLARRAFVSAQAMNQIVVSLHRHGWITRTQAPDHGRVLQVNLTSAGRDVLAACDRATAHVEKVLLRDLSADEVAIFRRMLERCIGSLSEYEREEP
jgi:DNA-binding MarR family transcriptional regulator